MELSRSDRQGRVDIPLESFHSLPDGRIPTFYLKKKGYMPNRLDLGKENLSMIKAKKGKRFQWLLSKGGGVQGIVQAEGNPVKGAFVHLLLDRKGPLYQKIGWSREAGEFLIGAEITGGYTLIINHPKWGQVRRNLSLTPDAPFRDMGVLRLMPSSVLSLKLVFPDQTGIGRIGLDLKSPGKSPFYDFREGETGAVANTNKDGTLRLLGLAPGNYQIKIAHNYSDSLIKSLRGKTYATGTKNHVIELNAFLVRFHYMDERGRPLDPKRIPFGELVEVVPPGKKRSYTQNLPKGSFRAGFWSQNPNSSLFALGSEWELTFRGNHFLLGKAFRGKVHFQIPAQGPPFSMDLKIPLRVLYK